MRLVDIYINDRGLSMYLKRLELFNHPILGNFNMDFTNASGSIAKNIIIAGENGTGKSTLLDVIFDFSKINTNSGKARNEVRTFTCIVDANELAIMKNFPDLSSYFANGVLNNELILKQDFNIINNWDHVKISFVDNTGNNQQFNGRPINRLNESSSIFKCVYSDVEINYIPNSISSVTSKDVDLKNIQSVKSNANIATEISQLLVDVQALDDADLSAWVRDNPGQVPSNSIIDIRMNRFKKAFDFMFKGKKMEGIKNVDGTKKVIFKENGNEIFIDKLSSGEKQIVFRGSFLLMNQKSIAGTLILVDEPEISMHPSWQSRIVDFYKKLFVSTSGVQISQLFFVTHSEMVLSSNLNKADTLVVRLEKDATTNAITSTRINAPFILPVMTSAEVDYFVFNICSIDYHIQLFNYIPVKYAMRSNSVKSIDSKIKRHSSFVPARHSRTTSYDTTTYDTLPSYIRNEIHHALPTTFTIDELRESLELLIEICK